MKQILVGKQIAYAAKTGGGTIAGINELDLLDTGAIAVFTEGNVLLTAAGAAAALADIKKIYIAVGNQVDTSSKSYLSSLIPRVGVNYNKQAYVAPTKQVKYVGYDGTTAGTQLNYPTLVVREEAQVKITDTSLGLRTLGIEIKRYGTVVKAGDTAAAITARIVTNINADPDAIVVAAGVATNTGISLTAKEFGTTFDVSLSGIIQDATIAEKGGTIEGVAVAFGAGEGTADQILALEDLASVERGNTNRLMQSQLWYSNHSLAGALTYNVYDFTFSGRRISATTEQFTYNFNIKVAIPSSGTAPTTAFDTIMAEVFGGVYSTSDQETGA